MLRDSLAKCPICKTIDGNNEVVNAGLAVRADFTALCVQGKLSSSAGGGYIVTSYPSQFAYMSSQ